MAKVFKILYQNGESPFTGVRLWKKNEYFSWKKIHGRLVLCQNGIHGSTRTGLRHWVVYSCPYDGVSRLVIWEAEIGGEWVGRKGMDGRFGKICAREMRLVQPLVVTRAITCDGLEKAIRKAMSQVNLEEFL